MQDMRNVKVKGYRLWVIGVLLVSTSVMAQAVDYNPNKRVQNTEYRSQTEYSVQSTSVPSVGFQSTSVIVGSGSGYSANPVLNEDGTASYDGAEGTNRIGKIRRDPATPGTPFTPGEGGEQFPLGDAVLPLMLLICAYCCFIAFRRRGIVNKKTDKTLLNDFNAMHILY